MKNLTVAEGIEAGNEIIKKAAKLANNTEGMKLVALMLRNMTVVGFYSSTLILLPGSTYLLPAIVKRKQLILNTINVIEPDVIDILITGQK